MTVSASVGRLAGRDRTIDMPAAVGTGEAGPAADHPPHGRVTPDPNDAGHSGGREVPLSSPFRSVNAAFYALTAGPDPLSLDLSHLDPALGLPTGPVDLAELRSWLAASS